MRRTLLLAAFASGLVVGCGGDDDDTTTVTQPADTATGETLSKAQYISQADAICREGIEATEPIERQFEEAQEAGDFDAAASSIRDAVETSQPYLDQLRELPIPENGADAAEELLTKREAGFTLSARFAEALEAEDQARIKSLAREINSLDDETDGIATGYGFQVCGQQDD